MLSVHFAPSCFRPACVGNCYMKTAVENSVPVNACEYVCKRIRKVVRCHLRHSRCTRCEEYQHRVIIFGKLIFRGLYELRSRCNCLIVAYPSLWRIVAPCHYFQIKVADLFYSRLNMLNNLRIGICNYRFDACCTETVNVILFLKLIRCRNTYSAYFVKRNVAVPEFKVTFQNEHNSIALFYSLRTKIRSKLIAFFFPFTVCNFLFKTFIIYVKHSESVRLCLCHYINKIISEIKRHIIFYGIF